MFIIYNIKNKRDARKFTSVMKTNSYILTFKKDGNNVSIFVRDNQFYLSVWKGIDLPKTIKIKSGDVARYLISYRLEIILTGTIEKI